jgi:hypothetical protein
MWVSRHVGRIEPTLIQIWGSFILVSKVFFWTLMSLCVLGHMG